MDPKHTHNFTFFEGVSFNLFWLGFVIWNLKAQKAKLVWYERVSEVHFELEGGSATNNCDNIFSCFLSHKRVPDSLVDCSVESLLNIGDKMIKKKETRFCER